MFYDVEIQIKTHLQKKKKIQNHLTIFVPITTYIRLSIYTKFN